MVLTVKGKPLKGVETFNMRGGIRVNIFDWQDGFYHAEVQRFDGKIWKREGQTKCIDKTEYEALKRKAQK